MKLAKHEQVKILEQVRRAGTASRFLAQLSASQKNQILIQAAQGLLDSQSLILAANRKDLVAAKRAGLSSAMMDRLTLTESRLRDMAEGVRQVAKLEDPVGKILESRVRPNGLKIKKVSVPLGVILIIYESRPNVTVDCAALCLKSGNAAILRGGREAFYTNQALAKIFSKALAGMELSDVVSLVSTTDRSAVDLLLKQEEKIHLVIPRGGPELIRKVVRKSRIPVIKHYQGVCHVYVDKTADFEMSKRIVMNAKLQRPGVCNAMETLLVHASAAPDFLPSLGQKLYESGCEMRAEAKALKFLSHAKPAKASDFGKEFLDKILAVKVVSDLDGAIDHIRQFGSGHTEAIVTEDKKSALRFTQEVDASSVMVNASTRFADGFQYGLGAEIGISTDKIHARGPMGLEGLTSYKYVVEGNGQIRS